MCLLSQSKAVQKHTNINNYFLQEGHVMSKINSLNTTLLNNVEFCFVDCVVTHYGLWYISSIEKPEWNFLSKLGDVTTFMNFVRNSIGKELQKRFGDNFEEALRKMPLEESFDICTQIADKSLLTLSDMHTACELASRIIGDGPVFIAPGLFD